MSRFRIPVAQVEAGGETWHVRSITASQFQAIMVAMREKTDSDAGVELLTLAVLYGLSDEAGKRILTDEDLPEVRDMPVALMKAIGEGVVKVSGMEEDARGN